MSDTQPLPKDSNAIVSKMVRVPKGHDAGVLTNYLNVFKSGQGQIHPYGSSHIVITDYVDSVQRAMKIMKEVTAPAK